MESSSAEIICQLINKLKICESLSKKKKACVTSNVRICDYELFLLI